MLTYYVYWKSYVPRSYVNFFVLKALKNYNETTEERKLAFENLKAKDEKSSYEIETQMRKLQRIQVINNILSCRKNLMAHAWISAHFHKLYTSKLTFAFQDNISQLKSKMATNAKECDERNRLIKEVSLKKSLGYLVLLPNLWE